MKHRPVARPSHRVPRSSRDLGYDKGRKDDALRLESGTVTQVNDDCSVSVDIQGEEIPRVSVRGKEMPKVGDNVDVHAVGDLLYVPTYDATAAAGVFVQPDEPVGVPVGTLWFDTDAVRP